MASFRDIWNLIVNADTSDVDRKLAGLRKTAEETGATADTSIRGRMGGALSNVAQKIPGVSGLMEKFGVSSSEAGALVGTAVAGGALVAGKAVTDFVQKSIGEFQSQAQEVLHFKEVSGLAADEASRFVAAADDFGVSGEDLATAIGKMDKAAGTTQHLQELGIQIGYTKDGAYDAQQTFLNVVDAFNNTDDASRKAAIGSEVFGKGWQSVVKLIEAGTGEIKDSFSDVKDFQIFSDADLLQSEDYRHKMDDLNDAIKGFEREVGQAAIPVVLEFTQQLTDMAEAADDALGPFGGLNLLMQAAATAVFPAYESSGGNVAEVSAAMVEEAKKNVDQMEAIALATPKATNMVDAFRASLDLTVGSGRDYVEANSAYRKSLDDQREAMEKATRAMQDYRQEVRGLVDDQLGLEGATYSALDAIDAYTAKVKEGKSSTRELAESALSAEEAFKRVSDQALVTAESQAELHGKTLSANEQIAVQVTALQDLAAGLDPSSPLRVWLNGYIAQLLSIPNTITSNIDIGGNGPSGVIVSPRPGQPNREGATVGSGVAVVAAIKQYEASNGTGWRQ